MQNTVYLTFFSTFANELCNKHGRFGAMSAVPPRTILWKIARYSPAASSVEAATASSRWDVKRHSADSVTEN